MRVCARMKACMFLWRLGVGGHVGVDVRVDVCGWVCMRTFTHTKWRDRPTDTQTQNTQLTREKETMLRPYRGVLRHRASSSMLRSLLVWL